MSDREPTGAWQSPPGSESLPGPPVPALDVAAAMNKVLAAEHAAQQAVETARAEAAAIIDGVSAAMSPDELIALNNRSVTEQLPAADIAADWLAEEGLA